MLQIADGMLNGTRAGVLPRGSTVVCKAVTRDRTLGQFLEETRRRKRFSIQALSRESGVSAGYIGQIESGFDPRTGKPTRPSPEVMRLLARALSDGIEDQAERIYAEMMDAAGYLPVMPKQQTESPFPPHPSVEVITRAVRESADIPERVQRAVIELLELTEEINRRALEEEEGRR